MRIPREFIRTLVDRADIADIVGERVQLKRRGANFFGLCPFHTEKTPSFSVNPERGFYHCFGCGAHGTALDFVVKTECAGDFLAGVEALAKRMGMSVPREGGGGAAAESERAETELAGLLHAAMGRWKRLLSETARAQEYLKGRGMTGETAARFSLGYAADEWRGLEGFLPDYNGAAVVRAGLVREKEGRRYDYFRGRVMFPIFTSPTRLAGFGGRTLGDDEPKYLNSPESPLFAKGRTLFGLPQAADFARRRNRLIVCEGYMDAVMLSQAGFGESVATMGTAATAAQMEKAARAAKNIIFAFDGDEAGKRAASRAAVGILPAVRDGMGVSFLFLPQGEDPDSYVRKHGAEAFEKLLNGATPLVQFLTDHFLDNAAALTEEGRKIAAASEGAKALSQMRGGESGEVPIPKTDEEMKFNMSRMYERVSREKAPFLRDALKRELEKKTDASGQALESRSHSREKARNLGNASFRRKFKMRGEGLLFRLLVCLSARPSLAAGMEEFPPLLGPAGEPELMDMVLSHLRFNGLETEEAKDIPAWLEREGYEEVAENLRRSVRQFVRSGAGYEAPTDEFHSVLRALKRHQDEKTGAHLVLQSHSARALKRRQDEKTGADRSVWLDKIRGNAEDNYYIPPLDGD